MNSISSGSEGSLAGWLAGWLALVHPAPSTLLSSPILSCPLEGLLEVLRSFSSLLALRTSPLALSLDRTRREERREEDITQLSQSSPVQWFSQLPPLNLHLASTAFFKGTAKSDTSLPSSSFMYAFFTGLTGLLSCLIDRHGAMAGRPKCTGTRTGGM